MKLKDVVAEGFIPFPQLGVGPGTPSEPNGVKGFSARAAKAVGASNNGDWKHISGPDNFQLCSKYLRSFTGLTIATCLVISGKNCL